VIEAALALALLTGTATSAAAQVFLAAAPHPNFAVGPLFVTATVERDLRPVSVNVSWSLSVPGGRGTVPREDLFLLWPGEVAAPTAPGDADAALTRYVEARGLQVLGAGRLSLRSRDRSRIGTGAPGDPLDVVASYVSFVRVGAPQLGAGTYVRIPWTAKLTDPLSLMTLGMPLKGMIGPKPATWFEELFWGRRWVVTGSFGDVGQIALSLFPVYFERRDHLVPLARDFSLLFISFRDAGQLRIDEVSPSTATRRGSRVRAGTETVSLLLPGGDGLAPQFLRVHFNYFSGRIAWRPIVISLIFLILGNVTGAIMLGQDLTGRLRRRFFVGRPAAGGGRQAGIVLPRETLLAITPGQSTYADVVSLCGPASEERQRLPDARVHSLVDRGSRLTTHRRRSLGWIATISHREVEHHEVAIEIENDRVRDVEWRVGRTRAD
jgi:hypothetical protein